jgi:hypothetical protein
MTPLQHCRFAKSSPSAASISPMPPSHDVMVVPRPRPISAEISSLHLSHVFPYSTGTRPPPSQGGESKARPEWPLCGSCGRNATTAISCSGGAVWSERAPTAASFTGNYVPVLFQDPTA